jgi:hypothetical protein
MAYDSGLAQRVREVLAHQGSFGERKMFGGLAFLLEGKMVVGILGSTLMARVGPTHYPEALMRSHVREMDFTGRPMKGYVYVDALGLVEDHALEAWIQQCVAYVTTLHAKRLT